ncbi:hypothetical protein HJC23_010146 [Cyclotella cryptica]|uniref:Uncharacterized protein n=1 Tax=Cyclotella cryptica TaxID=29204 RepID=A0ABD3NPY3_9STRA|eukprot:CCRYP_020300-RA/>CCRYP_020300-RA protein AED:0.01 eAED:0.01 QI:56/-1/1/1/-1/1/1/326/594
MQQHQQPHNRPSKPARLKIILLGSAGAGKTSLLRRFVNGTFRDVACSDGGGMRSVTEAMGSKRHPRSTMSTLGADYYVKRMPNPLFGRQMMDDYSNSCSCCCHAAATDQLRNNHESSSSTSYQNRTTQHHNERLAKQSHVLVQLWDTRGAEPSLPAYNRSSQVQFNMYQFLSLKPDSQHATITDRSGYHMHRYNNWGTSLKWGQPSCGVGCIDLNEPKRRISNIIECKGGLPCRDDTNHFPTSNSNNSPSSNALYNNIDACMLVYDATSSTSFLRLMSYHEELMRRFRCQELDQHDCEMVEAQWKSRRERKKVPFIVVANKIDLLDEIVDASSSDFVRSHRRSVMGFDTYRGMDEAYEYAVENPSPICSCNQSCNRRKCSLPLESSSPASAKPKQCNNVKKLTFSLKETAWSSDTHYLRSLQQADDQLSVNLTMVLLWCERNGIRHVEASALDGRGVDFAMEELVTLALLDKIRGEESNEDALEWEEKENDVEDGSVIDMHNDLNCHQSHGDVHSLEEHDLRSTTFEDRCVLSNGLNSPVDHTCRNTPNSYLKQTNIENSQYTFLYQPKYEKKLDLLARYSTKEDKRCSLNCLR